MSIINSILSHVFVASGQATDPVYAAIDLLGPYVLGVCAVLSIIYGIILGVKLAKAEDTEERKKVQKTLINFIIGAVSVLLLLVILYAIRGSLQ